MKTDTERYGAVEKGRAVLAAWTETRKASELCRELGVSATLFCQWQDQALSGMLEALEPRGARVGAQEPALPAGLKRLIERKVRARELSTLSRSVPWRGRTARTKAAAPTPTPAPCS